MNPAAKLGFEAGFKAAKDPNFRACLKIFVKHQKRGRVSGQDCQKLFLQARIPKPVLAGIWSTCDSDHTGDLDCAQFMMALQMIRLAQDLESGSPPTLSQLSKYIEAKYALDDCSKTDIQNFPNFLPPPNFSSAAPSNPFSDGANNTSAGTNTNTSRPPPSRKTPARGGKSDGNRNQPPPPSDTVYTSGGKGIKDRLRRGKHQLKAKLGKGVRTVDSEFNEWLDRITTLEELMKTFHNHVKHLLKAYKTSFSKGLQLAKDLQDLYESDAPIFQAAAIFATVRTELIENTISDLDKSIQNNVLIPNSYSLSEFNFVKQLIVNRDRICIDYDDARSRVSSLSKSTSHVEPAVLKEAQRREAQFEAQYTEANAKALEEIKKLFTKRYSFLDPVVSSLESDLHLFHRNIHIQYQRLQGVCDRVLKDAVPGETADEMLKAQGLSTVESEIGDPTKRHTLVPAKVDENPFKSITHDNDNGDNGEGETPSKPPIARSVPKGKTPSSAPVSAPTGTKPKPKTRGRGRSTGKSGISRRARSTGGTSKVKPAPASAPSDSTSSSTNPFS